MPQASRNVAESQSIYRFWANRQVTPSRILASHQPSVAKRCREHAVVLAIQDTTDLDFGTLKKTTGLGFYCQTNRQGIKLHNCLAVSGEGEPLGVLHQYAWSREQPTGKRGTRRQKSIKEKESQRWIDTLKASEAAIDPSVCLVHVGDREADIYELFAQPRRAHSELLLRVGHNRKVQHELGYLIPTVEQAPILGQQALQIERNPTRPARQATLSVRGMQVTIEVPRHHVQPEPRQPVTLNVLLVEEITSCPDSNPIRWLLLTSLAIDSFEQAWQCVRWYSLRWRIERFHFTLKSGCRIEQLQLESAHRLLNAVATYSIVAWRLMWLTYHARLSPDASCEQILEPVEWKLLRRKFEPKNRSPKPPTIRQVIRWIARLGGFLARKNDGEPGLKTIWRGITAFQNILEGVRLGSTN